MALVLFAEDNQVGYCGYMSRLMTTTVGLVATRLSCGQEECCDTYRGMLRGHLSWLFVASGGRLRPHIVL